jgi:hypothetical protein
MEPKHLAGYTRVDDARAGMTLGVEVTRFVDNVGAGSLPLLRCVSRGKDLSRNRDDEGLVYVTGKFLVKCCVVVLCLRLLPCLLFGD